MVQVSYPGVYVQEVPSGSRTITGVPTSVAMFVGMASAGPVNEPVRVLSFTDYVRVFSDDTSKGEMTDQVRQFFINGGGAAWVMRVAKDAGPGLMSSGDLNLKSRSFGTDANSLRAQFDMDTASPGSLFNLTIYRESVDGEGNVTTSDVEKISNLSLLSTHPRYIGTVLDTESKLVELDSLGTLAPASGSSLGGNFLAAPTNLFFPGAGGQAHFSMTIRNATQAVTHIVEVNAGTSPGDADAERTAVAAVINAAFSEQSIAASVEVVDMGAGSAIEVLVPGWDVVLGSAPGPNDVAADLGLGVDNGGQEVSSVLGDFPVFGGIVVDDAPEDWASLTRGSLTGATITLTDSTGSLALLVPDDVFPDGLDSGTMSEGTRAGNTLANVRENIGGLATFINREQSRWFARVEGTNLVLHAQFGNSDVSGATLAIPGLAAPVASAAMATSFTGAADGTLAETAEYDAAYEVVRSQVDNFNLLILPRSADDADGTVRETLWGKASAFCFDQRALLLMDAVPTLNKYQDVVSTVKGMRVGLKKDHAAFYWPRVEISGDNGRKKIDPSGSVAGLMARIDSTRGVWKAPAGNEAELLGTLGTEVALSDAENGVLNPEAANCIRLFPSGIVNWGARTMDGFDNSGNDDYKYVPVRRLALHIAESLERGLKFAVFEPNDEPLWAQIRLAAGGFMNNLFRKGAFQGATAREAYFVKVDHETTTQNDINLGIVNVVVGFAALKPAEFVVVTLKQQAGQIQI